MPGFYTVDEAQERLGVSEDELHKLAGEGKLKLMDDEGVTWVSKSDVDNFNTDKPDGGIDLDKLDTDGADDGVDLDKLDIGEDSPLAECELGKEELRQLARHWQLPTHDKPASPCLASRIAYDVPITPQRVAMIDRAEQFLRQRGFRVVRVRLHEGDLARVEVPVEALPRLLEPDLRRALAEHLHQCGFRYATIDLEGFRSGSLNE